MMVDRVFRSYGNAPENVILDLRRNRGREILPGWGVFWYVSGEKKAEGEWESDVLAVSGQNVTGKLEPGGRPCNSRAGKA